MSGGDIALATAAVAVGACVQGVVGFGLGLIAAPLLALLDPDLVPGPLLFVGVPLTVLVALRERAALDFHGIRWAIAGRVPGTIAGSVAVALLPDGPLVVLLGFVVLLAVVLSVGGWSVRPTTGTLVSAGLASGFMGTATSIGGPPMAMVYQRVTGPQLRATLAAYFVFGASFSLLTLAVAGEFGAHELELGLTLLPGVLAGFALSWLAARVLDRGYTRVAVLGCSAASALVLIGTQLAG
ncbi:MAG TPA: TSUP family transporter [Acidimicrobiales bacterium]|nr:TSUP family transporter [Acidimicrobiales bacterium]